MPCPFHGLARLPGQVFDNSAQKLRRLLLKRKGTVSSDEMLEDYVQRESQRKVSPILMQAEAYATASFVIEQFWTFLRPQRLENIFLTLKKEQGEQSHQESVRTFMSCFLTLLDKKREEFIEEFHSRMKSEATATHDDALTLIYFSVAQERFQKKIIFFPMMSDLIVMFGRMMGVAPVVFRRDAGRAPSEEELFGLFRHPSIMRFFLEIMSNGREATLPLIAKLEGFPKANLDDLNREFGAEFFEVRRESGVRILRIKPSVVLEHRAQIAQATDEILRQGKNLPRAMDCPVLYTGKFKEMYAWVCQCFEAWYTAASP